MSFFKFKSLVLFIKIVTKLLLLRPFENNIYFELFDKYFDSFAVNFACNFTYMYVLGSVVYN